MAYGTYLNPVPYGSTTVHEEFWEDWFIDEVIRAEGLTQERWDELSSEEQNDLLVTHQELACEAAIDREMDLAASFELEAV